MRPPSLRQLRAFRLVISTGGITAAAEASSLTQPALSKQIAQLEETVGLRLFHRRKGGPMIPTKEGVAFYKSIEGTLFGLDAIPGIAREIGKRADVQLQIAATAPLVNCQPFMTALALFREHHPNIRISLASRQRVDLEDWVRNRQADFALGLLDKVHNDLDGTVLAELGVVAVVPANHSLASKDVVTADDLESLPVILPSRQPLRNRIDAVLPDLSCQIETSSSISCPGLAVSQNAVALCDPLTPTMYPPGFVKSVPFRPAVRLPYGVIQTREAVREPMVDALLEHLSAQFEAFQKEGYPATRDP